MPLVSLVVTDPGDKAPVPGWLFKPPGFMTVAVSAITPGEFDVVISWSMLRLLASADGTCRAFAAETVGN